MLKRSKIDDDPSAEGGSDRVLVVNPNVDSLELIARLLESRGWRVSRLKDPAEVMIELGEQPFAGIVVDLPDVDESLEVVRNVRGAAGPEAGTPVLVLSTAGGDEGAVLGVGANGFLARPFYASDFLAQAETVLGAVA